MAQIFSPAADTWLRLALLGGAVLLLGTLIGGWDFSHSTYATGVGWVSQQPVPFSHKHHVGDDGIDCRFCHAGVETSARAGLPSTHVCMTCHSQLWTGAALLQPVRDSLRTGTPLVWHRVAILPDYVYFNHSIHVTRGVGCVECHGRVDRMPLMMRAEPFQMKFCLECHRDPVTRMRPRQWVTRMEPIEWSDDEKRTFGKRQMAAHRIFPAMLDNCEICHR